VTIHWLIASGSDVFGRNGDHGVHTMPPTGVSAIAVMSAAIFTTSRSVSMPYGASSRVTTTQLKRFLLSGRSRPQGVTDIDSDDAPRHDFFGDFEFGRSPESRCFRKSPSRLSPAGNLVHHDDQVAKTALLSLR